jgi:NAD(P)H dehydrogenase (quinone)
MSASLHPASRRERVAIAGATGRVGAAVANLLAADDLDVVALTRRPAEVRFPVSVAVAGVDFDRAETLRDALQGVDRFFLAHGTSPRQVENEIALIDAGIAVGVRHVVKLSALGPASRLNPFAWHMKIEAHLASQPVASTVIRPSAFADILKLSGPQIAAGAWTGAAGGGRVNFIDTRDIAKVVRVALFEDVNPESQRAYHLTGPRTWTMQQVAAALSELLARPVSYNHCSPEERRAALLAGGSSPLVADLLVGLDQVFRESVLGETTSTVQELTGEPPRPLEAWLAENMSAFTN